VRERQRLSGRGHRRRPSAHRQINLSPAAVAAAGGRIETGGVDPGQRLPPRPACLLHRYISDTWGLPALAVCYETGENMAATSRCHSDDDDDDDESISYVRPLLQQQTVTSVLMIRSDEQFSFQIATERGWKVAAT